MLVAQSCPTLCDPTDCSPPGSSVHGDSPGRNTGLGCHSLLQRIFPTQGSNPSLLDWWADSSPLSHLGSLLFKYEVMPKLSITGQKNRKLPFRTWFSSPKEHSDPLCTKNTRALLKGLKPFLLVPTSLIHLCPKRQQGNAKAGWEICFLAARIWPWRNPESLGPWVGRLGSSSSILELLRQRCRQGQRDPLASVELSHPGLAEDGCRSYTMSRDMNRCPLSRLGGVANKKGKSEWKENCISSPPCDTWLFQHIWFVTFADCLVVIKEIRVDER